jgi:3-oxoacyl-[acyl-carrier protein] reductase
MSHRIVLVTGAAGGIGSAIVRVLVRDGFGVIATDKYVPDEDQGARWLRADLENDHDIQDMCSAVAEIGGALWGLVLNAGVYPIVPFSEYPANTWDKVQQVNLRAPFLISQRLCASLELGGRIVMVASGAAHIGSRDPGYSSSKAGLLGLMRTLAIALAPQVAVNAVCPGIVESPMSARMSAEETDKYLGRIPMRRVGAPEEVAVCVSFLLDPRNAYMTGATIDVNGGLYCR